MKKGQVSFKNKLLVPVIAIFVLSILTLSAINYVILYSTTEAKTNDNLENFVDNTHSQIKHLNTALEITTKVFNDKNITTARSVAQLLSDAKTDLDSDAIAQLVERLNLIELNIVDGNGVIVKSNKDDYVGFVYNSTAATSLYMQLIDGTATEYSEEPRVDALSNNMAHYAGVSRIDDKGFVQLGFDVSILNQLRKDIDVQVLIEETSIGKNGFGMVLSYGLILAHPDQGMIDKNVAREDWYRAVSEGDGFKWMDVDGERYYVGFKSLDGNIVMGLVPQADFFKELNAALRDTIIFTVIALIILFAVVNIILNGLVKPIKKLSGGLSQIAQGDLTVSVANDANDEIGELSRNLAVVVHQFASMTDDINSRVMDAAEGEFSSRVETSRYPGDWGSLMAGLNSLMDAIVSPINEASSALLTIAGGDYKTRIRGDYKGKFAIIKDSVNTMADSIESYIYALDIRLRQQSIMTAISQSFLFDSDKDTLVTEALHMTGEFIGAEQVLFFSSEGDGGAFTCLYEWANPASGIRTQLGGIIKLDTAALSSMKRMADKRAVCLNSNDPSYAAYENPLGGDFPKYITAPVFVKDKVFGILHFSARDNGRTWSESKLNLAAFVAGLLSGVFEKQLIEGEIRRLSSLVESSPQLILYVTPEGNIDYVNPAAETITGYAMDDLTAGGLSVLFREPVVRDIREKYIPRTLENGTDNFEISLICKDGQERIMAFSSFTTKYGAANVGTIASDVTEIRLLERELISAKELAEQGSRSKSEFLARMSHEIRTPMNAIIGMTNIAKGSTDPSKKEYCLGRIANASHHLLGIINDILDMSKIEADKFELSVSEFSFEHMLLGVLDVFHFRIDERRQNLSIYIDPAMPEAIIGDRQRLAQVITNLLTNAVKFTPEKGYIAIKAKVLGEKGDMVTIQVEIADSGIGISDAQKAKLFRSFEQADGSIARKFGGTGLGLAISKRIIALMGGEIWVESVLGKGSEFIFSITVKKTKNSAVTSFANRPNTGAIRAMVVDDSAETRDYFTYLMDELGIASTVASGGAQALEIVKNAQPFDILFVDWEMPTINGAQLIPMLRKRYAESPIMVMVPPFQWSDIEDAAKAAGANGFIPKPIFPSLLVDCLKKVLGAADLKKPAAKKDTRPHSYEGKTALLAEDVELNREIIVTMLEDTALKIECAENGRQAVEMFAANPQRYDILFMDIHMPEIDGFEATRRIRALDAPEGKRVPIIAMTANVFREDIEKCLAAGMNDHIGKPINFDDVFLALGKYLGPWPN